MTDEEKVLRHNFRGSYDDLIPAENGELVRAFDYDRLAAKLAEVKASSQGWIDAAVEQQVRRKRAEERILEVTEDRDAVLIALASARKQLERYIGEAEAERVAENDLRKRKRTLAKLRGATTPKEPN